MYTALKAKTKAYPQFIRASHEYTAPTAETAGAAAVSKIDWDSPDMAKWIKNMQGPSTSQITLPDFNPDLPRADARMWCSVVDSILESTSLEGEALTSALRKCLKGTATSWLSLVSYPGMNWPHFRKLLLARYSSRENLATSIYNVNNSRPNQGECLAAYTSRTLEFLTDQFRNRSPNEIAVGIVLAHMAQFDPRLRRLAFSIDIASRTRLLEEVHYLYFMDRTQNSQTMYDSASSSSNRSKVSSTYSQAPLVKKPASIESQHLYKSETQPFLDKVYDEYDTFYFNMDPKEDM